ncbi:MAG: dienelactone hydrolase family protein [Kiloniellales bacterium]
MKLRIALGLAMAALLAVGGPAGAAELALNPWPAPEVVAKVQGRSVTFPSTNPFTIADLEGDGQVAAPGGPAANAGVRSAQAATNHEAKGTLFLPDEASAAMPVPAVVLLHGARGLSDAREFTYARQFTEMGVAAMVVDVFGSRRELATSFNERLINITEAMVMADAFAALRYLRDRPEIDETRIALIGFSYGGMATLYAAHRQVADLFARHFGLGELRFAAHAAYYAPCIATFEDERATGAPVLMQWGGQDQLVDGERCRAAAEELRAGGATVETIVYDEAYHQWDGSLETPWRAPRGLAGCDFLVTERGLIRGRMPGTPFYLSMTDALSRKILLGLCSDSVGYLIAENDSVRKRSNAALGHFLMDAFNGRATP